MNIYERLMFLAKGGRREYMHKKGKENKRTTELQSFLDNVKSKKGVRNG